MQRTVKRKPTKAQREFEEMADFYVSSLNLPLSIWGLLERDAEVNDRSISYIAREIFTDYYGLDKNLGNRPSKVGPPRSQRG